MRFPRLKNILPAASLSFASLMPGNVMAATNDIAASKPTQALSLPIYVGTASLQRYIGYVIQRALGLVGVVALIVFVWAGFTWMTAQGDAAKVAKAQKAMVRAAVGLIIIFGSYALVRVVVNLGQTVGVGAK